MKNRKVIPTPTDCELDILNILWSQGPLTVRVVHDDLMRTKPSQYTTTLKIMQIMAEKGLLTRNEVERAHVYRPAVERDEVQRQLASTLMKRAFGGSAHSLLVGALSSKLASKKELSDLRQLIEEHQKGQKEKRGK